MILTEQNQFRLRPKFATSFQLSIKPSTSMFVPRQA
jgi:hypothetical protein